MTKKHIPAQIVALIALAFLAPGFAAYASEVTGTLSSDGTVTSGASGTVGGTVGGGGGTIGGTVGGGGGTVGGTVGGGSTIGGTVGGGGGGGGGILTLGGGGAITPTGAVLGASTPGAVTAPGTSVSGQINTTPLFEIMPTADTAPGMPLSGEPHDPATDLWLLAFAAMASFVTAVLFYLFEEKRRRAG